MRVAIILLAAYFSIFNASAGFFSRKEGSTFETKGEAVITRNSAFKFGIERRNIPIPLFIDVRQGLDFKELTHDNESGWTQCRIPLKQEIGLTGPVTRSLVFDCKPLTYFK